MANQSGVPPAKPTVLVVDEERGIRELLGLVLRNAGFAVRLAASGQAAIEAFAKEATEIRGVILDLGSTSGLDVTKTLQGFRQTNPAVRCYVMSAGHAFSQGDLGRVGAESFFAKPFKLAQITDSLRPLLLPPGRGL